MQCPRCHEEMRPFRGAFRCKEHGMLITAETMRGKDAAQRRLAKADESVPSIQCPECKGQMRLVHPKEHDVDLCDCGALWLDRGEEKIIRERYGEAWWMVLEPLFWLGLLFS